SASWPDFVPATRVFPRPTPKTWMPGIGPGHDESTTYNTRPSLRRLGLRGLGGALRRDPPLDEAYRQDRSLVESDERQRQRHLAEHVGRREHRRDHKGDDDEIAAFRLELIGGEDADTAEQRENHRK